MVFAVTINNTPRLKKIKAGWQELVILPKILIEWKNHSGHLIIFCYEILKKIQIKRNNQIMIKKFKTGGTDLEETTPKVNLVEIILFTVCSILVIDTFVAPAIIGVSSITIWVFTAILFFIPYGLISAELGAAYPDDGGIYAWVNRAYGEFSATLVGWFYWVNVAMWMPAVYVAFAYWFAYAFFPDMSNWAMAIMAVILGWITIFINIRGIDISVKFTNLGAILKVGILLAFGVFGVIYGMKFGFKNDFSFASFVPSLDNTLLYSTTIVYNLMGFELISTVGSKIENPEKNIPIMTILAGVLIASMYIVGTFGILAAMLANTIDPVDGFLFALEELTTIFGSAGPFVFKLITAFALYTLITNMISWTMGGTEVLTSANLDTKSGLLGHRHPKYGTADYAYYIYGFISSFLVIVNFSLSENANEIFWTILAFSFVIFLMPYLWLFPTVVKLRKKDRETERPYKVPGGDFGLKLSAFIGEIFIAASIAFLFLPDESYNLKIYYTTLIVGTLITVLVGIGLYKKGRKH